MKKINALCFGFILLLGLVCGAFLVNSPASVTEAESELAAYQEEGSAVVTGQMFVRTKTGSVVTGAGKKVALVPGVEEVYEFYASFMPEKPISDEVKELTRRTVCDAEGKYRFENVPAGKWYITGKVNWKEEGRARTSIFRELITVEEGKTLEVILSDDLSK